MSAEPRFSWRRSTAAVGIAVLRASGSLAPLSTAAEDDLVGPFGDLVDAVLRRPATGR